MIPGGAGPFRFGTDRAALAAPAREDPKLTFARGAWLKDPAGLFNSSLDGNVRRAIDIHEGDAVDERAFKALIRQAVALNRTPPDPRGAHDRG